MNILIDKPMEKSKRRWRKEIESNGITKQVSVREADNGYVIEISKYGSIKNAKGDSEYVDERKEFISKTNPLEDKTEESKSKLDLMEDFLKEDFEFMEV